jgi:hypothetical protein
MPASKRAIESGRLTDKDVSEERTMNFRQCVIDCIAGGEVVQSFNRLHGRPITPHLLSLLNAADHDQPRLAELAETEQELLACFILFVHRHVYRKMKFAEARVTRITRAREEPVCESGTRLRLSADQPGVRSYVRCDEQLRPDFGTSVGQEPT